MDGVKLTFQPEVYEYIVDKAVEYKLGARGLRSIVETIMMDVMFEIPSDRTIEKCVITKGAVEGESEPLIYRRELMPKAN